MERALGLTKLREPALNPDQRLSGIGCGKRCSNKDEASRVDWPQDRRLDRHTVVRHVH